MSWKENHKNYFSMGILVNQTAKICSCKSQIITNPQNKSLRIKVSQQFLWYTVVCIINSIIKHWSIDQYRAYSTCTCTYTHDCLLVPGPPNFGLSLQRKMHNITIMYVWQVWLHLYTSFLTIFGGMHRCSKFFFHMLIHKERKMWNWFRIKRKTCT